MTGATLETLRGRCILVAEDEYWIAQEIAGVLSDAGADILGPVSRLADAARLVAAKDRIDGALLDVNLGNEASWPVVDILLARNVPMVLGTGYDTGAIPTPYVCLPRCEKPFSGKRLARELARLLENATPV